MKKIVLGIIIGILIMTGVGVVAYNYNAKDIEYTPSDSNWNVNNISDAIDELKNMNGSNMESLIGTVAGDGGQLNMTYTSNYTGKMFAVITVVSNTNPTALKVNSEDINVLDNFISSSCYKGYCYRIQYAQFNVNENDIITCSTKNSSSDGKFAWSFSSCSLYKIN